MRTATGMAIVLKVMYGGRITVPPISRTHPVYVMQDGYQNIFPPLNFIGVSSGFSYDSMQNEVLVCR